MLKPAVIAAIALVVGLVLGFLLGRAMLERQWSQPYTEALPPGTKGELNNPSPVVGTKVLKPMPIGRSRAALKELTAGDPVVSNVAAVGANDDSMELHVVVENRGKCTVTSLAGVAYGFDAYGRPSALNAGGETYVAFQFSTPLPPGKRDTVAQPLKGGIDDATLAVAHVDRTTCSDGTTWKRQ
jgi:hypothetical protein